MLQEIKPIADVTFKYLGMPGDGFEDNSRQTLWQMTYVKDGKGEIRDLKLRQKQVLECLSDSTSPLTVGQIAEKVGVGKQIITAFLNNPNPVIDFIQKTSVGRRRYAYSFTLEPQDLSLTEDDDIKAKKDADASPEQINNNSFDLYLLENPSISAEEKQVVYLPDYLGSRRVEALKELFHRSTKSFEKDTLSDVWVWVGQNMGERKNEVTAKRTSSKISQGATHPDMIM